VNDGVFFPVARCRFLKYKIFVVSEGYDAGMCVSLDGVFPCYHLALFIIHFVQKKTPTHSFFHISMNDLSI